MRWIKASERLPELIDRKSTPKHVRYLKKRCKGEPEVAIAVAYYFPDRFKTVEWEDLYDYNQEDFPYTEEDVEMGVVWLRAGWYIHGCDKCEGYWTAPLDVVEWLDETAQSTSAGALVEALEKIAQMKREPGETTDTYAFNRCWHIATEALKQYSSK
jgi:hypothetical protein